MRFCCFYLTGKQDKKRGDFDNWRDYGRYVASLIEIGDSVKMLDDHPVYRDEGVRQGHRGRVVRDVWLCVAHIATLTVTERGKNRGIRGFLCVIVRIIR